MTDPNHCQCPTCVGGTIHASDCAVHNAPALPVGDCDCGALAPEPTLAEVRSGMGKAIDILCDAIAERDDDASASVAGAGEALEAAQKAGLEFRRRVIELSGQRARLIEALEEVCRVLETNSTAIVDTVWVSTGAPETLLDHCRAALAARPVADRDFAMLRFPEVYGGRPVVGGEAEMPPLPEPAIVSTQTDSAMRVTTVRSFSHDQMDAYGEACARAALARQAPAPLSQAVTEDARDGERLDWLETNSAEDVDNATVWASWPAENDSLREAIDAARHAQTSSGKVAE